MRKTKTRILSFLLALLMCLSLTPAAGAAEGFSDVGTSAWYYNDVMECAGLGVVTGYEDGRFDPEGKVTGVQFIVMLTRTFYSDKVEAAKATETGSWYAPNAKVAQDTNMSLDLILNDTAMNRYNMAMALYNVIIDQGKKSDVTSTQLTEAQNSVKDWDQVPKDRTNAVKYNYAFGILTGMSDGCFHGEQTMTRAQACMVTERIFGKTGFPFREVTRGQDVRPGDVIIMLNDKGQLTHVAIVASKPYSRTYDGITYWGYDSMSGNIHSTTLFGDSYGHVHYTTQDSMGSNIKVFTRYPEGVAE